MNDIRTRRSQRFFNGFILKFYDVMLYRLISAVFWKLRPELLIKFYSDNLSARHLDVGVGTGYLLRHSIGKASSIDLSLMDLNENCLNKTEKIIYPIKAKKYHCNILEDISGIAERFSSISVNYVMHCIPGDFAEKGIAFDNLHKLLDEDGVLFGSSVLSQRVRNPFYSAALMWVFNIIGLFDNSRDSLPRLREALNRSFAFVEITESGPAVLFRASNQAFK